MPREDISLYFPELISGTAEFGPINELSILLLTSDNSTLHIDHTIGPNRGVEARLNIPIINTAGSYTAFYEGMDNYPYATSPGGTKCWSNELRNSLTPVTWVEVIEPTILRTSQPHTVLNKNGVFPRITITMSFVEDLVKYLE